MKRRKKRKKQTTISGNRERKTPCDNIDKRDFLVRRNNLTAVSPDVRCSGRSRERITTYISLFSKYDSSDFTYAVVILYYALESLKNNNALVFFFFYTATPRSTLFMF